MGIKVRIEDEGANGNEAAYARALRSGREYAEYCRETCTNLRAKSITKIGHSLPMGHFLTRLLS